MLRNFEHEQNVMSISRFCLQGSSRVEMGHGHIEHQTEADRTRSLAGSAPTCQINRTENQCEPLVGLCWNSFLDFCGIWEIYGNFGNHLN